MRKVYCVSFVNLAVYGLRCSSSNPKILLMRCLLALSLLSSPVGAYAATTIYTNRALFESQLAELIVDDYENPGYMSRQTDAVMSAVLNETKYTATGFINSNLVFTSFNLPGNRKYCAGCNGSFRLQFTETSISRSNGVDAVGFEYSNSTSTSGALYRTFVTYGDGSTAEFPLSSAAPTDILTQFFGINSDRQITSIHLGRRLGGSSQTGSFSIDNLTVGRIPEPTSLAVLCLGSLCLLRRR
jgi:hypothetical protein